MQKYKKYDHVMIDKDLGSAMSHFESGCEAIVMYSYADKYSGDNTGDYSLYFKGGRTSAWYEECQLTLIRAGQKDLYDQWHTESLEDKKQKSNLDWIFDNGELVLTSASGASIEALAGCLGLAIKDIWGPHGEGVHYYINSMKLLSIASSFLVSGDKKGWLEYCLGQK